MGDHNNKLSFHPVDASRWPDLVRLFEGRGGPHYCWCMVWRKHEAGVTKPSKQQKKAALQLRVDDGVPIGILAYLADEPVAWCSVAPRETFRQLGGVESEKRVWSIVCFFIQRQYRGQGIMKQLISAAVDYARRNGAAVVEAYPINPGTQSYRFMGYVPVFEAAGFRFIKKAGKRRNVMLLECQPGANNDID